MPTYAFDCRACGRFDAVRSIARRDEPTRCPHCGERAMRAVTAGSFLGTRSPGMTASSDAGDYVRMRHSAGCQCCS